VRNHGEITRHRRRRRQWTLLRESRRWR